MKFLFFMFVAVFSFSIFAIELDAKILRSYCHFTGRKMTIKHYLNQEETLGYTESRPIQIQGVELVLPKIIETAQEGKLNRAEELSFTVTYNEKTYILNTDDSLEAGQLIRLMTHSCR